MRLRVLISGREVVVQENESEFRRPRQILTILPYYTPPHERHTFGNNELYINSELLKNDLRQEWWRKYGRLTGRQFNGLPDSLSRTDLDEVTSQPLLNYLVALSFSRNKLNFSESVSLNAIYEDLVAAVHYRGYEKRRVFAPIKHLSLQDFTRVLEEIGLAAWHGDGRSTTVREIEEHCRTSGVGRLLESFQEGARTGVTRLLAAFFFRQHGERPSGDPTFVFTHKSFGEYLAALRLLRAVERCVHELESRASNPDAGWDEREALRQWVLVTGPNAMSRYLHPFLLGEIARRDVSALRIWQSRLAKLFSFMLKFGTPMEVVPLGSFRDASFQARNAEEALLVALNACARITRDRSMIEHPEPTALGAWFRRVQGQRMSPSSAIVADCLSYIEIEDVVFDVSDLYGADLSYSKLLRLRIHYSCLVRCNLSYCDLRGLISQGANFEQANLEGANLSGASLLEANFHGANLRNATIIDADTKDARFLEARLEGVNSTGTELERRKGRGKAIASEIKALAAEDSLK